MIAANRDIAVVTVANSTSGYRGVRNCESTWNTVPGLRELARATVLTQGALMLAVLQMEKTGIQVSVWKSA